MQIDIIGKGGSGVIVEQSDTAWKLMNPNQDVNVPEISGNDELRYFSRGVPLPIIDKTAVQDEIETHSRVSSIDEVVSLYEVAGIDGLVALRMQRLRSNVVRELYVNKSLTPSSPLALRIGLRVAYGIRNLHDRGVVHYDIKLSNVLLDDYDTAYLCDFGLSRYHDESLERSYLLPWTSAEVISPEAIDALSIRSSSKSDSILEAQEDLNIHQFDSEVTDPRSVDTWALGVIMYEMATGLHPISCVRRAISPTIEEYTTIMKGFDPMKHLYNTSYDFGNLLRNLMVWDRRYRLTDINTIIDRIKDLL